MQNCLSASETWSLAKGTYDGSTRSLFSAPWRTRCGVTLTVQVWQIHSTPQMRIQETWWEVTGLYPLSSSYFPKPLPVQILVSWYIGSCLLLPKDSRERRFCQVENVWSKVELVKMTCFQFLFLLKYAFPANNFFRMTIILLWFPYAVFLKLIETFSCLLPMHNFSNYQHIVLFFSGEAVWKN